MEGSYRLFCRCVSPFLRFLDASLLIRLLLLSIPPLALLDCLSCVPSLLSPLPPRSLGNHAQGVALSGRELGIACTIVMPLNTPSIKYTNVERLGARVVLHGADFDESQRECARLAGVHGLTLVPPFNDPYVISGQGTAAVEMVRQTDISKVDAIFVPVGGGGFLAGVSAYIKAVAPPHVKIIGVETYDADALAQTLKSGEHLTLSEVGLFADGTAVRKIGDETLRVCAELVDEIILVSNDELCAAIKDVFSGASSSPSSSLSPLTPSSPSTDTRTVPEPSGALGVAGAKKWIQQNNFIGKNKRVVSVVSGANINFSRLRFIAERAELGEGKEAMLRVIIPEKPGAYVAFLSFLRSLECLPSSLRIVSSPSTPASTLAPSPNSSTVTPPRNAPSSSSPSTSPRSLPPAPSLLPDLPAPPRPSLLRNNCGRRSFRGSCRA
jgi:threonine dehydratase